MDSNATCVLFEHKSCRKQLRGEQLFIYTRQLHLQIASVVVNLMDWSKQFELSNLRDG